MKKFIVLLVSLGLIFSAVSVSAQETTPEPGQTYYVISASNVNARSCPRVSCAIVTTFAPGTDFSVSETVTGDAVSGNTRWLHSTFNGRDVYVHSSLAALRSPTPTATEASDATSDWSEHTGPGFTIKTPPAWINLASDPQVISNLLDQAAQGNARLRALIDAYRTQIDSGLIDVMLIDPLTASNVVIVHQDMSFPVPLSFLGDALTRQIESLGGKVLETEHIQIAAGDTLRFHIQSQYVPGQTAEQYDYVFESDSRVYFIALTSDRTLFDSIGPLFDQIVNSFALSANA